ncbi:MAG TPA: TlpA disulfide reductase family protein [Dehalococcoidia bacterium]|nr:TlpA disulfide reductase family protein [Dehalococcoidia bacterium]
MNASDTPSELDSRPQAHREWSGYLRSLVLPIALVVAIVGGLLLWESRGSDSGAEAGFGTVELPAAKNTTGQSPSPTTGRAAPDFLLRTLDGETVRLSDLQGRPVLVNFWASWCAPCRQEMPDIIDAYEAHSAEGFVVVGVNLREADSRVQVFVDDYGVPFPVGLDRNGEVARTWRIGGPTQGLPSSYFIDRQGIVRKVVYGTVTGKALTDGLSLILGTGH